MFSFFGFGIKVNPFLSMSFCVSLRICFDSITSFWLSRGLFDVVCLSEQKSLSLHTEREYGCIHIILVLFFLYVHVPVRYDHECMYVMSIIQSAPLIIL